MYNKLINFDPIFCRMVHAALKEEMEIIHAITLKTQTPEEYNKSQTGASS